MMKLMKLIGLIGLIPVVRWCCVLCLSIFIGIRFPVAIVAAQDIAAQEIAAQEIAAQEIAAQEIAAQEIAAQEIVTPVPPDAVDLQGFTQQATKMGVRFRISLYCANEAQAEQAFAAAFAEIDRLEQIFSDYRPDSEAALLSETSSGTEVKISPAMSDLLLQSQHLHEKTKGYFDVTLGRLTKIWRAARKHNQMPLSAALDQQQQHVGMQRFSLSENGTVFCKGEGEFDFDFGGIAKGYAADQVLLKLRNEFSLTRVLVDASGDVTAGDPPPGTMGWVVGLAKLRPADGLIDRIHLKNASVASSGDANQFLQDQQQRFSHLIDPHTKSPIDYRHVTIVVARSGAIADGLASALSVCPPDQFQSIVDPFPDTGAIRMVQRDERPIEVLQSKDWERLTQ